MVRSLTVEGEKCKTPSQFVQMNVRIKRDEDQGSVKHHIQCSLVVTPRTQNPKTPVFHQIIHSMNTAPSLGDLAVLEPLPGQFLRLIILNRLPERITAKLMRLRLLATTLIDKAADRDPLALSLLSPLELNVAHIHIRVDALPRV